MLLNLTYCNIHRKYLVMMMTTMMATMVKIILMIKYTKMRRIVREVGATIVIMEVWKSIHYSEQTI